MSGGSVPYHLRQNKAIERNLFVELLSKVNRFKPISDYTYIGFGGPFLEDFKLMHSYFGSTKMISLESDLNVYSRQLFNSPLDEECISCRNVSSGNFIDSYSIDGNAIIWLDYASPKLLGDQVREFSSLITKLRSYDILKITINANPVCLGDPVGSVDKKNGVRFSTLKTRLGTLLPSEITKEDMTWQNLPLSLLKVLQKAVSSSIRGRGTEKMQLLSAFVYADSEHQMLTMTAVILPIDDASNFLDITALNNWNLVNLDWHNPERIKVPELTIRERLFIDSRLPSKNEVQIQSEMNVLLGNSKDGTISLLKDYIKFYRHFPYFSKVVV